MNGNPSMPNDNSSKEWINWSGSVRFTPARTVIPSTEREIADLVKDALSDNRTIRTVGTTHSCSRIFETNDTLVSIEKLKGLYAYDVGKLTAVCAPGMTVEEIGMSLFEVGLGMENTGHIDKQTLAGAVSTGTHGAGKTLPNLSGQVTGVRLVTGTGEIKEYNIDDDPEILQALKVSLGSMGIFTAITLRVLPAYQLHRTQYCAAVDDCLNNLQWMTDSNRNFCFYWYPRRDDVSIRTWNFPDTEKPLPFGEIYKQYTGWGKDVLPTEHNLKYNELEYSLEAGAAVACFQEVRKRVKEKHRKTVGWRILFRPVAADNVYLSNAYGRDTVAITIHQNSVLPYREYFDDIEPIFKAYGGRPHWGKKHSMSAAELKMCYPEWDRFQGIRRQMDPHGVFLNNYLKRVFIEEQVK